MALSLFSPDIFSKPYPVFKPVSSEGSQQALGVLAADYDIHETSVLKLETLDGLEINSRNLKIITADKIYALKRCGAQVKPDDCRVQLELTQELFNRGVRLPCLLPTVTGDVYALKEDSRIWILSEFVEGSYFTGAMTEFSAVIQAVSVLQTALEDADLAKMLPLSAAALTWDKTATLLEELFNRHTEWAELFPPPEYTVLFGEADYLREVFDSISSYESHSEKNIVPTHIDLHPHNILIGDDQKPVIVDIDSLQRADRLQSLAFAVFKLTRQVIVQNDSQNKAVTAQEFMNVLNFRDTDAHMFLMAATAEVLRRIGIIADLNMHKSNRDWNAVLHLQLAALHELPYVFGMER